MSDIASKVAHVKRAGQSRNHTCHWPGCTRQVPPAMWGCRGHWFTLPKTLRNQLWEAYRPGQEETMTPSREYLQAADAIQRWIREREAARAQEQRSIESQERLL